MDGSQSKEIVMRNWLNGKHEMTLSREGSVFFFLACVIAEVR